MIPNLLQYSLNISVSKGLSFRLQYSKCMAYTSDIKPLSLKNARINNNAVESTPPEKLTPIL